MVKGVVHIYTTEYYSITKMNEGIPFAAIRLNLEIIILSEVRKKGKYLMIPLLCGILNMTQMNLFTKQKQTHRCKDRITKGEGVGEG